MKSVWKIVLDSDEPGNEQTITVESPSEVITADEGVIVRHYPETGDRTSPSSWELYPWHLVNYVTWERVEVAS